MKSNNLTETYFFDFSSKNVETLLTSSAHLSGKKRVIELYFLVRDSIRYNPFAIAFEPSNLKASHVVKSEEGHCIHKATLLIALYRAIGVPARLGLARVRNHMGTSKFEKVLGTDVLNPHGFVEVFLSEKWVKCTPAFNKSLCEKLGVEPLNFNGEDDSVFQAFDRSEDGFMQYLEDHGTFSDVPVEFLAQVMQQEYPHLFDESGQFKEGLFR
ncbi:MAG: transglutaminase-like domain-containing protein [Flavobacteriales bacterium]|nr:transglutaminase-like domain-containing protein [Flavobacteriales bacterium]